MTLEPKVMEIDVQSQCYWLAAFVGCYPWGLWAPFLIRFSGGFLARFAWIFQIARPSVWPSVEQIVGIVHVPVCLALK